MEVTTTSHDFSGADGKWRGHHRTLVADVADDVRSVCIFANQDLPLPLKTDDITKRVQRLSSKLATLAASSTPRAPSDIFLKSGTENTSTDAPARQGDCGLIGIGIYRTSASQ